MIRLHERQLAMLVFHFCLRYTIQCITRVQQGPQSSILFGMGPPSNSSLPGPFIPVRHCAQGKPFGSTFLLRCYLVCLVTSL